MFKKGYHLQSFNQSLPAIQSFVADCPITSDSYGVSEDYFFVFEILKQDTTSSPKTRLYAHLSVYTIVDSKPLSLKCRVDTVACVNVIPVKVYKINDYSFSKIGTVQTNLRI